MENVNFLGFLEKRRKVIEKRKELLKKLISEGANKKELSHARVQGFEVVILRHEGYEIMFFLNDNTKYAETCITRITDLNSASALRKVNDLNSKNAMMNFSVKDNKLCLRAWSGYDIEEIYQTYLLGLHIAQEF